MTFWVIVEKIEKIEQKIALFFCFFLAAPTGDVPFSRKERRNKMSCRSHSSHGEKQKEREDDDDVNDDDDDGSNNALFGNERNRRRKRW